MTAGIFDAHTHLDMGRAQGDVDRAAATLLEEMRACGISQAILLPLVELGYTNDDMVRVTARCPFSSPAATRSPLTTSKEPATNNSQTLEFFARTSRRSSNAVGA